MSNDYPVSNDSPVSNDISKTRDSESHGFDLFSVFMLISIYMSASMYISTCTTICQIMRSQNLAPTSISHTELLASNIEPDYGLYIVQNM